MNLKVSEIGFVPVQDLADEFNGLLWIYIVRGDLVRASAAAEQPSGAEPVQPCRWCQKPADTQTCPQHWLRGSHPTPLVAQSQHHPAMAWEGVGQS
ncbi:hypothetical protein ACTXKZ_18035 [Brachybacterium alimentarium]|uniref:hypothetical protein n=1 Tax=Brachybacterium alimentarium TaxID=47845 RepID=UPI003FD6B866